MTDQRPQRNRLWAILSIFVAALMLLSACVVTTESDGEVVEPGGGDPVAGDLDCAVDNSQTVRPSTSMIGFVGEAEISSDCGDDITSQTLTVCIQYSPGTIDELSPTGDTSPDFDEIGCVEAVGVGFASAQPTFSGVEGNNWYRHRIQLVTEDTPFDDILGTTTNITTFDPIVTNWVDIHCFEAVEGCASGFAVEPEPEPTPTPDPTPEPEPEPTPTAEPEDPIDEGPCDDVLIDTTSIGDGPCIGPCDDVLIEPGTIIDDGPCTEDPSFPPPIT